ncbi:MAG: RNA polymerase sigma factor [Coprobacillaceae bacterium]
MSCETNLVELVSKAIDGDKTAFEELYKACFENVYFIAISYFKNEEIAKDIVQEVFVKVYKQIKTLKNVHAFHVWIKRITYHCCVDLDRKGKYTYDLGDNYTIEEFEDKKTTNQIQNIESVEMLDIIADGLDSLSIPLKTVGILRFYDDMSISDISEILDIPEGTVSSRLTKIRTVLKRKLENNGITPSSLSMVLVTPELISKAYALLENNVVASPTTKAMLFKQIRSSTKINRLPWTKISMMGGGICVTLVSISLLNMNSQTTGTIILESREPIVTVEENIVEQCQIIAVNYDTSWTNTQLTLNILTSNDNYDQILVNGMDSKVITQNGEYRIQLLLQGQVLDEEIIVISNFDYDSPRLSTQSNIDTLFYLTFIDAISGVDYNSIRYYENGVLSNNYTIEQGTLIITSQIGSYDTFYISDYAGNELSIIIRDKAV